MDTNEDIKAYLHIQFQVAILQKASPFYQI